MKKTILLLLAILLIVPSAFTQKIVLGTVDYSYKVIGEGADQMAGMMPNKMVIKYGKNGLSSKMEGGMMAASMGKTVVNGETGDVFMIKESEKVLYVMSKEEIKAEADKVGETDVKSFDDTKTIMGYKCKKYTQSITMQGQTVEQTLWATDELKTPDYESEAFRGMAGQGGLNFDIDGFPMLIEIGLPMANLTLQLEVSNIDFGKIPAKEFEKPKGYTEKPFSEMSPF
jgi:hypothetical protein